MNDRRAFTLIELLVVIAILGILMALLAPVVAGALQKGRMVQEKTLGRNLMMGLFNYAADHDGTILPGYRNEPVTGPDGRALSFPASARYPWRLLPYAGGTDKRIVWATEQGRNLTDASSEAYSVSISPTFGMNIFYVGGDDSGISGQGIRPTPANVDRFGPFCLTRIAEAVHPSRQLVFTSARMPGENGRTVPGYYMVQAPKVVGDLWSAAPFSTRTPPAQHGFVDFRYDGRAVVAHLDGHVELLNETDLRDMRRWSNLAAADNDPDARLVSRAYP
jgi:prepilin-type N-terminal cleavage/methylation domain-containing protein/prepilin-type processing-associated H-X9-DG protein